MSLAVLFAIGAMISWGIGDFLIQKTVKKLGAIETLFWITACSSIILIPLTIKSLFYISSSQLLLLLVLGIVGFLSAYVHFRALNIGKLSVVEIILSLELILTILFGIVFFHETLSWWQIILMLVLFLGILLISVDFKMQLKSRDFLEKGASLAFLSALLLALINFLTAASAKTINPVLSISVPFY